jgi:putative transposase
MLNMTVETTRIIHDTNKKLVEEAGHKILFLPKYSPDLNDIEHDFAALKRARMYAAPGTSIDEIIREYCTA